MTAPVVVPRIESHEFRWVIVDGSAASAAACSCGAEFVSGSRFVRGNPEEVRSLFRLHLIDVDLDARGAHDAQD